jgi:hypothetical protein
MLGRMREKLPPLYLPVACALSALSGLTSPAAAQVAIHDTTLGGGTAPPMPLAINLKQAPAGSWAEYRVGDGKNDVTVRLALVTRTGQTVDVETQMKSATPHVMVGTTVMRMTLPLRSSGAVMPRGHVIQIGTQDPMLLPPDIGGLKTQAFQRPDPKKRIGSESVTVPAGTFKTDHYRDQGEAGMILDFWVSKEVPPFGLVKLTSSAPGERAEKAPPPSPSAAAPKVPPPGQAALTMELIGRGGGAKPVITKAPKPFDPEVVLKQVRDLAGAGQSPGPAPNPAPAPAK